MKKSFILPLLAAVTFSYSSISFAEPLTHNLNKDQQGKLDKIEAVLVENPDLIDGLLTSLNLYLDQQNRQSEMMAKYQDWIYNNPQQTMIGKADAALTIVNITDFNCPYCKKLDPVLEQLVKEMPNDVRVVNIYVPLKQQDVKGLGTTSAEFALNVWQQDRDAFELVNQLLVKRPQVHDKNSMTRIAKHTGTEKSLTRQAETRAMIDKNYQMFTELGLRGTPAMIMGTEVFPGYMPIEQLRPIVKAQVVQQQNKS
ncbi:DsbA family protein [Photobacterium sp. DNB22_13_2]